jgi:hypothetical protein
LRDEKIHPHSHDTKIVAAVTKAIRTMKKVAAMSLKFTQKCLLFMHKTLLINIFSPISGALSEC